MGFLRTSWESLRTPPGQQAPRVFQAALQQPRLDADNGPAAQAVLIIHIYEIASRRSFPNLPPRKYLQDEALGPRFSPILSFKIP